MYCLVLLYWNGSHMWRNLCPLHTHGTYNSWIYRNAIRLWLRSPGLVFNHPGLWLCEMWTTFLYFHSQPHRKCTRMEICTPVECTYSKCGLCNFPHFTDFDVHMLLIISIITAKLITLELSIMHCVWNCFSLHFNE